MIDLHQPVKLVVDKKASDLRLSAFGLLVLCTQSILLLRPIAAEDIQTIFEEIASLEQRTAFARG